MFSFHIKNFKNIQNFKKRYEKGREEPLEGKDIRITSIGPNMKYVITFEEHKKD